jgi:hypothetical protein
LLVDRAAPICVDHREQAVLAVVGHLSSAIAFVPFVTLRQRRAQRVTGRLGLDTSGGALGDNLLHALARLLWVRHGGSHRWKKPEPEVTPDGAPRRERLHPDRRKSQEKKRNEACKKGMQ